MKEVSAISDGMKKVDDIIIDSSDACGALDAPLTEIARVEIREDVDAKLYAEGFRKLANAITSGGKSIGVCGGGWGLAVEKEKETLIALVGWESLEVSALM